MLNTPALMRAHRRLIVQYDVSGLTDEQVGALEMEAVVQAEESDTHPSVPLIGSSVVNHEPPMREILVHLNVQVPMDDRRDYEEIVALVQGAIAVGSEGHWPMDDIEIEIALAEEIT